MDKTIRTSVPVSIDFNDVCIDVRYGNNYKKSRKFSWKDINLFSEWLQTKVI